MQNASSHLFQFGKIFHWIIFIEKSSIPKHSTGSQKHAVRFLNSSTHKEVLEDTTTPLFTSIQKTNIYLVSKTLHMHGRRSKNCQTVTAINQRVINLLFPIKILPHPIQGSKLPIEKSADWERNQPANDEWMVLKHRQYYIGGCPPII